MNKKDLEHFLKSIGFGDQDLNKFGLARHEARIMFDGNFFKIHFKLPVRGSTNLLTQAINFKLAKYPVTRPARMVVKEHSLFVVYEYEIVPEFTYYETDWDKTVEDFIKCLKVINKL